MKQLLKTSNRFIHLLYAPTNFCNMGCQYCYLGTGTEQKSDTSQALSTLKTAVERFLAEGITPFNLSFHGGEATAIPQKALQSLLDYASDYYQTHGDKIKQAGYPLNPVHIKTNLYNFDHLYDLFDRYEVSISGSVDLPLSLHEKFRTDKKGHSTLAKITSNLKLLADYPHHKKISCVVTRAHFEQLDQLIADIKYIHYDIGLDMTKFNVMFGFDSVKNDEKFEQPIDGTQMLTQQQQVVFYRRLVEAFTGTELEAGLKTHWFKEFTPEFCCSAVNCGDKFFLLQSNGDVYACPRGQSSPHFYYGNLFKDSINTILANGWQTIEALENRLDGDEDCFSCNYLPHCNQGCVFVRDETTLTKSYTCLLQKELYKDNPEKYPAYSDEQIGQYAAKYKYRNKIQSFKANQIELAKPAFITPELAEPKNSLSALIAKDPILTHVYSDQLFVLTVDGVDYPLVSPILSNRTEMVLLGLASQVLLKVKHHVFSLNSKDPVNNTIHIMLLRNTMVSYGDEGRTKQEHLVDHSIYQKTFESLATIEGDWLVFNLGGLFQQYQSLFLPEVRNNLYVTTKTLREYHYNKQSKNAFYHIQAINLPFPFLEFYWR